MYKQGDKLAMGDRLPSLSKTIFQLDTICLPFNLTSKGILSMVNHMSEQYLLWG